MKLSSVAQTKNQLSALLEQVRQGNIEWLERNGIVRRGGGGFYALKPPVVPTQGCSALAALLDQRQTGR